MIRILFCSFILMTSGEIARGQDEDTESGTPPQAESAPSDSQGNPESAPVANPGAAVHSEDDFSSGEGDHDISPAVPEPVAKKKVGRWVREKEAEGTEAVNKFPTDPVIKSRYTKGGRPLEVDPN